jgi:acetyl esterase
MLDPQARALIDLMLERQVPPTHTLSPTEARHFYRERRGFTQPEAPAVGRVQDLRIAGPGGALPVRLYQPPPAPGSQEPHPVLVYYHGGGWVIGDLDTHDVVCRQLCLDGGCAVLAVDYRLGPEHRFPAATDDALAAVRWLRAQGEALGLDAARLALGGDSAGGNLAAATALAMCDAGDAPARLQLLIYPATDMRLSAPSHTTNGQGYVLTHDTITWFREHYIADPAQWTDWRASPLLAVDLSHLPPALVLTAGFDPLRDEGRQYADALSAAGVASQYVCFERQIHGFITMGRVIDEANTALALCGSALRRALRG